MSKDSYLYFIHVPFKILQWLRTFWISKNSCLQSFNPFKKSFKKQTNKQIENFEKLYFQCDVNFIFFSFFFVLRLIFSLLIKSPFCISLIFFLYFLSCALFSYFFLFFSSFIALCCQYRWTKKSYIDNLSILPSDFLREREGSRLDLFFFSKAFLLSYTRWQTRAPNVSLFMQ